MAKQRINFTQDENGHIVVTKHNGDDSATLVTLVDKGLDKLVEIKESLEASGC